MKLGTLAPSFRLGSVTPSCIYRGGSLVWQSMDPDAASYFTRVEALGGSFDQSSINPAYTASYVKNAIQTMIVGIKSDNTWDLIKEMYLMCGVTFAGITAKLKHAGNPLLTNNGFTAGDLVAAGATAGMNKSVSTKGFWTGMLAGTDFQPLSSMHLSYYATSITEGGAYMSDAGGNNNQCSMIRDQARIPSNGGVGAGIGTELGMVIGSTQASNIRKKFINGDVAETRTNTPTWAATGVDMALFRHRNGTYENAIFRGNFFSIGAGLSDSQALSFASRVNALMASLGCNTY